MQKSNIYQHNLRLNLDDERHLKVHRYLMNIKYNKRKAVYIERCTCGLGGRGCKSCKGCAEPYLMTR